MRTRNLERARSRPRGRVVSRSETVSPARYRPGNGPSSPRRLKTTLLRWLLVCCVPLAVSAVPASGQLLRPDARWQSFDTEHFRVTFSEGLEPLARRAAHRAERAYALISTELLPPPSGRIELVIADNLDYANGAATVFPRSRIIAYAHPPAADSYLSYYYDWLDLLILHELVHVFHLEEAGGVWPLVRDLLGRNPATFPQAFTPAWIVEGLATYAESFTGAGRVRGSMYEMILRTAVLESEFHGIDQVTADPSSWPGSITRYLHGSFFIDHLANRFGPRAVTDLVHSIGRQLVPYRLDRAASGVLGTSLTAAWDVWADSLRAEYEALADSLRREGLTEPELLSTGGWVAEHPRFSPDGARIAYAASTGRAEPALMIREESGRSILLTHTTSLGPASWTRGGEALVHAQLEFTDPYSALSDLYVVDGSGRTTRVTHSARIREPDPHPDGDRVVAVTSSPGTNHLSLIDLRTGAVDALTVPDLDVQWAAPRWSPAGDRIAVSRWSPDGLFDIVVLSADGELLERVTRHPGVDSSPAWSPDGRFLLFSSDRTGIPNLFAHELESGRTFQVTNVLTGAFQPDVSPDGRWIAFSYYRSDGYYIARLPFEPAAWREVGAHASAPPPPTLAGTDSTATVRRYSAWPAVLPTWWSPLLVAGSDAWTGIGVTTGGGDVVDRHAWSFEFIGYPGRTRGDLGLFYRYRGRGNPVLDVGASQDWDVQIVEGSRPAGGGAPLPELARRDRELEAGLTWTRRRWRRVGWVQGALDLRETDFVWSGPGEGDEPVEDVQYPLDVGVALGLGFSSLRTYALSLGPQEGIRSSVRVQARRYLEALEFDGARRDYWRITTRNAAFSGWDLFGFAPSVFASRIDGGIETTASAPGFSVGGPSGSANVLPADFGGLGRSASYPVRGYEPGTQRGNRVVSGSLEYRFPIVLVERGFRLLPLALNRFWGDVFVDGGAAWCPAPCNSTVPSITDSPTPLASIGAEAIVDLRVGYNVDLPLRVGLAVPFRDPAAWRPQVYLRLGRSF